MEALARPDNEMLCIGVGCVVEWTVLSFVLTGVSTFMDILSINVSLC